MASSLLSLSRRPRSFSVATSLLSLCLLVFLPDPSLPQSDSISPSFSQKDASNASNVTFSQSQAVPDGYVFVTFPAQLNTVPAYLVLVYTILMAIFLPWMWMRRDHFPITQRDPKFGVLSAILAWMGCSSVLGIMVWFPSGIPCGFDFLGYALLAPNISIYYIYRALKLLFNYEITDYLTSVETEYHSSSIRSMIEYSVQETSIRPPRAVSIFSTSHQQLTPALTPNLSPVSHKGDMIAPLTPFGVEMVEKSRLDASGADFPLFEIERHERMKEESPDLVIHLEEPDTTSSPDPENASHGPTSSLSSNMVHDSLRYIEESRVSKTAEIITNRPGSWYVRHQYLVEMSFVKKVYAAIYGYFIVLAIIFLFVDPDELMHSRTLSYGSDLMNFFKYGRYGQQPLDAPFQATAMCFNWGVKDLSEQIILMITVPVYALVAYRLRAKNKDSAGAMYEIGSVACTAVVCLLFYYSFSFYDSNFLVKTYTYPSILMLCYTITLSNAIFLSYHFEHLKISKAPALTRANSMTRLPLRSLHQVFLDPTMSELFLSYLKLEFSSENFHFYHVVTVKFIPRATFLEKHIREWDMHHLEPVHSPKNSLTHWGQLDSDASSLKPNPSKPFLLESAHQVKRLALSIFERFVVQDSLFQVNLSSSSLTTLQSKIKLLLDWDPQSLDARPPFLLSSLFLESSEEIFQLMERDSFVRFLHSDIYKKNRPSSSSYFPQNE